MNDPNPAQRPTKPKGPMQVKRAGGIDGHPVVCKNKNCKFYGKSDKVEYKSGPKAYRCEACMEWTD